MKDIIKSIIESEPKCTNLDIDIECISFRNNSSETICEWKYKGNNILSVKVDNKIVHLMVFSKTLSNIEVDDFYDDLKGKIMEGNQILAKLQCQEPGLSIKNKRQLSYRIEENKQDIATYKADIIPNLFKFKQHGKKANITVSSVISFYATNER